jgi:hypothetical protein
MTTRADQLKTVQNEAYELFIQKNADYGDAFANYGPIGVLVRIGDKIQRLQHISNTMLTLVKTESLRDTLIDLHNYAAMVIMLLDEDANKFKKETLKPPQIIIPSNSESSISENESITGYHVGTPRSDYPEILERNYVTEQPYTMPQESGGRCSTS